MRPWYRGPIYEPKDSRFRPWSLTTLMAFVIGIFMHISTTILFESSDIHRFNFAKLAAIVVGTALAILSLGLH